MALCKQKNFQTRFCTGSNIDRIQTVAENQKEFYAHSLSIVILYEATEINFISQIDEIRGLILKSVFTKSFKICLYENKPQNLY